jgi:hypothetical protein
MISEQDIESSYAHVMDREQKLFEASEAELKARALLKSLDGIRPYQNDDAKNKSLEEERTERLHALVDAEDERRLAVHLHKMAKWEVQKIGDIARLMDASAYFTSSAQEDEVVADMAARNIRPRRS